jgi:hypothetical protein
MADNWSCPVCGWTTGDPARAREHFPASTTVFRLVNNEVQGICIGFEPETDSDWEVYCLDEDNGGQYVHILDNGLLSINKIFEGAEPDLLIWRTHEEFERWAGNWEPRWESPFEVTSIGKCRVGYEEVEIFQVLDNKANAVCDCVEKDAAELIKLSLNEYYTTLSNMRR